MEAKKVLLVLSGKGGVGKSTVSCQIALSFKRRGHRVGLLDIDLCGPSVPKMLGLHAHQVHQSQSGAWVPVFYDPSEAKGSLEVMSIGFLLNSESDAVIWRGPKKNAMIKQFLTDVQWGDLDLLGTSDEHMSIVEHLKEKLPGEEFYSRTSAVLVTSPQAVSVIDVQRELGFCQKCNLNVLGIIENMSGFICAHCSHCTNVFSQGGGKSLAAKKGLEFLGAIPLDTNLALAIDKGLNFAETYSTSPAVEHIDGIISKLSTSIFPESVHQNGVSH